MVSKDTAPSYYLPPGHRNLYLFSFSRILQKQDPAPRYGPRDREVQLWLISPVPYRAKEEKNGLEMRENRLLFPLPDFTGHHVFPAIHSPCRQVVVRNEIYYLLFLSFLNITIRAMTAIITTAPVASTISVT